MKTILVASISINGMIAEDEHSEFSWLSRREENLFETISKEAGVIIFGRRTFEANLSGSPLPDRLNVILTAGKRLENIPGILHFSNGTPDEVLREIEHLGYTTCIVGGGQAVFSSFLNAGLVDTILLTVTPAIFSKGLPFLSEVSHRINPTLEKSSTLQNGEVLLEYSLKR